MSESPNANPASSDSTGPVPGIAPPAHQPTTYRVYSFDALHKIVTADWIEAASDEDAIATAEAAGVGSKSELWEGRRLVAVLGGERQQA